MSGYADTLAVTVLQPPAIIQNRTFFACNLSCDYVERVFAGENSRQNDTSSFLYKKARSSDTIALELHRKGSKIADLNDNTLGTYYSTFTAQPLYVGFVVDWGLVFDAFTGGDYTIVANKIILGVASVDTSRKFYLNSYDDESANGTCRIEIVQDGNIISDQFDYTNLIAGGWVSQYRIPAKISKDPSLIEDSYLASDYSQLNVMPSSEPTFLLKTQIIPAVISDMLAENAVLANSIRLSDYNLLNPRYYNNLEVFPKSIEKIEEADNKEVYEVTFTRKKLNTIKTF